MLNQLIRDIDRGTIRNQARLLGRGVVRREHHRWRCHVDWPGGMIFWLIMLGGVVRGECVAVVQG
ncbi:hypothetical protein ACFWD7_55680, partial [Streptomyces mirabilis]|uniref:hypothetical protein n=1 Tax=Streptomyces mirabilis TaxID=68239 RepID=UPI0036D1FB8A